MKLHWLLTTLTVTTGHVLLDAVPALQSLAQNAEEDVASALTASTPAPTINLFGSWAPTKSPTRHPTKPPTPSPTASASPTKKPTRVPTESPTPLPTGEYPTGDYRNSCTACTWAATTGTLSCECPHDGKNYKVSMDARKCMDDVIFNFTSPKHNKDPTLMCGQCNAYLETEDPFGYLDEFELTNTDDPENCAYIASWPINIPLKNCYNANGKSTATKLQIFEKVIEAGWPRPSPYNKCGESGWPDCNSLWPYRRSSHEGLGMVLRENVLKESYKLG